MPFLLLPLAVLALLLLWLLLLPFGLLLRYKRGRARQRAFGWIVASNAWLLLVSVLVFLASAWGSGMWVPHALPWAASGLLAGMLVGLAGVWRTRFELAPSSFYYTPDRWLVLLLTAVVALRIGLGMWQALNRLRDVEVTAGLLVDAGSLFAVAGLLMGYHLIYAWGLRRRWRKWRSNSNGSQGSATR